MMAAQSDHSTVFISGRTARTRLGITHYQVIRLAALGRIRTEALPGSPIRYLLADVERLAAEQGARPGAGA